MVHLQFAIPDDLSFPQAIALAQEILDLPTETDAAMQTAAIIGLLKTSNGARGFFVTFLTGDNPLADHPTDGILKALRSAPTTVADLMTKNLAMSTAMELTHQTNGDTDQAAGSARVKARSRQLIKQLQLPELQTSLQQLLDSTASEGGQYQDFLHRWGYDAMQRQAIHHTVSDILAINDAGSSDVIK
ncbi:hypothetical protein IQ266_14375 [filamentous cyanobacterium LEGE 11480]|uniref:Uncharacterized protein n=1 Tax=Romeriopsis navalis LEGE 11480 TaxID=2777977 RepID=A0A928Z3Q1_9CYAN|nr:hypothetical protein [Romeriopsis navalis]MBE9030919.1 hypothetical protein [Romeriopsis navalis LEGE 11480]